MPLQELPQEIPLRDSNSPGERQDMLQRYMVHKLIDFCSGCRFLMCQLLELEPNQIHCCIKGLLPGPTEDLDSVHNLARSKPLDQRAIEEDDIFYVGKNTVWSALLGKFDGQQNWRIFKCFACNDLRSHAGQFICSREHWERYYNSTLVFPLAYAEPDHPHKFSTFGFLAFDSNQTNAFKGLPDIFEHLTDWNVYHDILDGSTIFNFGAAAAVSLAAALRPLYQPSTTRKIENDEKRRQERALLEEPAPRNP